MNWAECRVMQTIKKAPADRLFRKSAILSSPGPSARPDRRSAHRPTARLGLAAALIVLGAATAACAPRIDTRGNAIHIEAVKTIEPNVHTRDHVLQLLGSPSSRTTFGDDVWYYISERTETTAFFTPEVVERQVIAIHFDKHGVVKSIDTLGKESAENVEPVDRTTPTAGNSLGVIEQLLSNVGRFNRKK